MLDIVVGIINFLTTYLRPFIEVLYFIAQIVIVVVAIIGLRQLKIGFRQVEISAKQLAVGIDQVNIGLDQVKLLKEDINLRNYRMSVEKSIEYIDKFPKRVGNLNSSYQKKLNEKGLELYNGPIGNFGPISGDKQIIRDKAKCGANWLLNELELLALLFRSKLGDEEVAFQPLAKDFIDIVDANYDIICYIREKSETYYENIIWLYNLWKEKLEFTENSKKISELQQRNLKYNNEKINPIGVNKDDIK